MLEEASRSRSLIPLPDGNQFTTFDGVVHHLVCSIGSDFQHGLIEAPGAEQDLTHEISAALCAHLARLGEANVYLLPVAEGAHAGEQEVAVLLEVGILAPEETKHESIVPFPLLRLFRRLEAAVAQTYEHAEIDLRPLLSRAYRSAVAAADPALVLSGTLPGPPSGRLVVVGAGKAAAAMAQEVERHYGQGVRLEGLVITPDGHSGTTARVEVVHASHPVPDRRGVEASERILALLAGCGSNDRVLVLVSGGGSALLCLPDGLPLSEKASLTRELLRSGADIGEMNAVRKHLSLVKGGRLALAAAPAPVTALVLSDVVGDDLSTIASGPTVTDPSSFRDALEVLDRYGVEATAARAVLEQGVRGERSETPKPGSGMLAHAETRLVGSNQRSLEAAAAAVEEAGFPAHVLSNRVVGEAREAGGVHAAIARQILDHGQPFSPPCALLSGGETTVTVRGRGRGGRNGEFALGLALGLPPGAAVHALAADTDGIDGSDDNAGVFVTPALLAAMDRPGARESLHRNDSYSFFAEADQLFVTGPTGTNVNDLRILLVGSAPGRR